MLYYNDMKFRALEEAEVIKREKRFRLYIKHNGEEKLSYLPNPGRLQEIIYPSAKIYVMPTENPKRKTRFEAVLGMQDSHFVSLNASLANKIFEESLPFFPVKVKEFRREVYFHGKRYDFLINSRILIEVKSVTLVKDRVGLFPDAPTKRGAQHLEFMIDWIFEKWVVFVVQRDDVDIVMPNKELDPRFYNSAKKLYENKGAFFAFKCNVNLEGIYFKDFVNVKI